MSRFVSVIGLVTALPALTPGPIAAQEKKEAVVRIAAPPPGVEVLETAITCDMDVVPGKDAGSVFPPGSSTTVVLVLRGKVPPLTTEVFQGSDRIDLVVTPPDLWGTAERGQTKAYLRCCPDSSKHPRGFPDGKYTTRVKMDGKVVLEAHWSIDPKSPIPPDAKRMQGKWRAIDFVEDGRVRGTEGVKVNVAGDRFTFTGGFGERFTRRLDVFPYDNPKQMNLTKSETESFPCLYGFVGDRLKLCIGVNGFRPGQMRSNRGDGTWLLELEREPK
jgi:uncharacterized protein (TIGR03067 family)